MKVSLCGTAAPCVRPRRTHRRNISCAYDARGRRSQYAYDDSGRLCMAAASFDEDFDKETNLNYNYFRDYDPNTGRYVQSDPIGLAGGINTYGYVGGNPVWDFDSDGLMGSRGKVRTTPRFPGSSCGPEGSLYNYPNKFWGGANIEAACQAHDRCYENCNKSKRQCDSQFYSNIRRACLEAHDPVACNLASIAYYSAVSSGGEDPFRKSRLERCSCRPD